MGEGPSAGGGAFSNKDNMECETVPGDFDADDMIVMDGVTIDQTDDGTIQNHYIMQEPSDEHDENQPEFVDIHSGEDVGNNHMVDVDAEVDEMIRYQNEDEETTSQFQ